MRWERRTRELAAQGLIFGVLLTVAGALFGGPPKRSTVERIPDPLYQAKRGTRAMLYGYDPERDRTFRVKAARSAGAYRAYWRALDIDDQVGADEVEATGEMVGIEPKTGVLVLEVEEFDVEDPRPDTAIVRVEDGPHKGQKFWVPTFQVVRLRENPAYATPAAAEPPKMIAKPTESTEPTRKSIDQLTPDEIKEIRAGADRQRADSFFNIAENLRKSGKYPQARKQYMEVIRDYSSHPQAALARERLKTLPK